MESMFNLQLEQISMQLVMYLVNTFAKCFLTILPQARNDSVMTSERLSDDSCAALMTTLFLINHTVFIKIANVQYTFLLEITV